DVFYLHSRLLERAAKLSDDLGAGSMTALPIIETKANDVGAFIPTNVISITDGQVFLESDLFNQGVRPAINVGVSVSRVGGDAQTKGMKKVAGNLRLDLAAYRDLEAFATFASDLDEYSKAQLDRGERLVELLKQNETEPQAVEDQMVSIYLAGEGELDNVPVQDVRRYEAELWENLHANHADIYAGIAGGTPLSDEAKEALKAANAEFAKGFQTTDGTTVVNEPEPEALAEGDLDKHQITVSAKK
ncbi:MAG TPA: F0F1 ATP synthase subunit alpha, partial [Corynebacterium variabile]|nr:F0F1 ATP synthase subunit alpha [Corynebacterium variabile]